MQVNTLASYSTNLVPDIRAAIDFREWLGGEHKINEYTHELAVTGGRHLAQRLGTSVMDPDGELTLSMVGGQRLIPRYSFSVLI